MPITQAEYIIRMQKVSDLFKESLIEFGIEGAENVVDLVDAIKDAIGGEFKSSVDSRADAFRQQFGTLNTGFGSFMLNSIFADVLRLADSETLDPVAGFGDVFDFHLDQNLAVKSRGISFDTVPTETGTGDNTFFRLTTDSDAETIENGFAPLNITAEVTEDQGGNVERFEEIFTLSAPVSVDALDTPGRTNSTTASSAAVNRDGGFVENASFQNGQSGGSAITPSTAASMTPWVDSTNAYGAGRYVHDTTDTYRSSVEETDNGLALSLNILVDGTISQPLDNVDDFTPYFWSFRIMRKSSATGTVTMKVGTNSTCTVSLASLTNDVWTIVTPDLDENLFPVQFKEDEMAVSFVTASLAVDSFKIDTVTFDAMVQFNGGWFGNVAGIVPALITATPKKYVFNDTIAVADSVIQRLVSFFLGLYLPSVADATQVTAAGGRTLTYADAGGSDTITASSGDFDADGFKVGMVVTSAGTSNNNLTTGQLASVTATVLTFGSDTSLTNEGPLSATATLDATAAVSDP